MLKETDPPGPGELELEEAVVEEEAQVVKEGEEEDNANRGLASEGQNRSGAVSCQEGISSSPLQKAVLVQSYSFESDPKSPQNQHVKTFSNVVVGTSKETKAG